MEGSSSIITTHLAEIEAVHGVSILYACESGSRCWGFESRDSDWDVRFIFTYDRHRYLALTDPPQQLDVMRGDPMGQLDIVGWDLKKALGLVRKSNPAMLEWVRSPIVYVSKEPATRRLRELTLTSFSPVASAHHYGNLARSVVSKVLGRDEVVYKRYFYLLRPLFAVRWIAEGRGIPPVEFLPLLDAWLPSPGPVRAAIDQLLVMKRRGDELSSGPRVEALHEFLSEQLDKMEQWLEQARALGSAGSRPSSEHLDAFFRAVVDP